jgi:hypothetical protein
MNAVTDAGCYITLEVPGKIQISERGAKDERGHWTSTILVQLDDTINLRLSFSDGKLSIELDAYHIKNNETDRVFHADLECKLAGDQLEKIRGFIDLCCDYQPLLTADPDEED